MAKEASRGRRSRPLLLVPTDSVGRGSPDARSAANPTGPSTDARTCNHARPRLGTQDGDQPAAVPRSTSCASSLAARPPENPGKDRPMNVFRTPDERFEDLPGYPYEPHYVEVNGLRLHHIDEGTGDR